MHVKETHFFLFSLFSFFFPAIFADKFDSLRQDSVSLDFSNQPSIHWVDPNQYLELAGEILRNKSQPREI